MPPTDGVDGDGLAAGGTRSRSRLGGGDKRKLVSILTEDDGNTYKLSATQLQLPPRPRSERPATGNGLVRQESCLDATTEVLPFDYYCYY